MWWIPISLAAAGAATWIYSLFSDEEKVARQNWEDKRKNVEQSIKQHEEQINNYLKDKNQIYSFHDFVSRHYSSMLVANNAYRLFQDSITSSKAMNRVLAETSKRKKEIISLFEKKIKYQEKKNLSAELHELNETRNNFFSDRDTIKLQGKEFLKKLKKFNNTTRSLKLHIRNNCGSRGYDWYQNLEERTRLRKI